MRKTIYLGDIFLISEIRFQHHGPISKDNYKFWGVPPKCLFSYDVISVTPPVTRRHSGDQGVVDYKYWDPLPGSVTFDLTTRVGTSIMILSSRQAFTQRAQEHLLNVYAVLHCSTA